MSDLIGKSAVEVVGLLRADVITPLDCLAALEQRINQIDGEINALPTRCFDRARVKAKELMAKPIAERGPLAGLPVPIKDLADVAGVRSTKGSLAFKDHIPVQSDIAVSHLEQNGAIVYAMSNTPEFGAGGNTFNGVFGATLNPWNTKLSAAGSSGGAAAALATGMAWIAHGSDAAGSLRNPASFCGVVGLRPSPGRVASSVTGEVSGTLGVEGPMARNVEDTALMLDAMAGEEAGDPISCPVPAVSFLQSVRSGWKPARVALSRNLGITPVDPEVADIVFNAARRLEQAGVIVEENQPDFSGLHECFDVLRAMAFATGLSAVLEAHRSKLKPEVIWNIEKGLRLTGSEIARAEAHRAELFRRVLKFFNTYDLILCPATIVPPFPVEQRHVSECDGQELDNYYRWLAIAYAFTTVCCPAMSIPAGFTREALPVGIQIAGPPRGEARLLAGAKLLETVLDLGAITPIDPRVPHREVLANPASL